MKNEHRKWRLVERKEREKEIKREKERKRERERERKKERKRRVVKMETLDKRIDRD